MLGFSTWLRARGPPADRGRGTWAVSRLGFRSAASRPARSVLSAALIASAAFIIFSIDAFRAVADEISTDPRSGTGGFALLAQSEIPLLHDPNTPAGRDALLVHGPELARAASRGSACAEAQDASCLNLYRPTSPTIIAPDAGFIESNRFTFAGSLAATDAERANPGSSSSAGSTTARCRSIADATSLQYVLHAAVGDTFSMDIGADRRWSCASSVR